MHELLKEDLKGLESEERLELLGMRLIRSILGNDELSLKNRKVLLGKFKPDVFINENHLLYYIIYQYRSKGFPFDANFISLFLTHNPKILEQEKEYVNLSQYDDVDVEDRIKAYYKGLMAYYKRLVEDESILLESDFALTLEQYKLEWRQQETERLYAIGSTILSMGYIERGKTYLGYEDSIAYVKRGLTKVDTMLDDTNGSGFIDFTPDELEDDKKHPQKIGDWGLISEFNEAYGGIYSGLFYNFMAPPKAGKTKFTSRLAHNLAVVNGNNVTVWAREGGYKSWEAQSRAIHFDFQYNSKEADPTKHYLGVTKEVIERDGFKDETLRKMELASALDLTSNKAYGRTQFIDRPFKVETFIDDVKTSVLSNKSKAVIIDYVQLIGWEGKSQSKAAAVGKAYQDLLALARDLNVAVITPSQFTQEFIKEMAKSQSSDGHELRVAGGESSEIVRTPDVNIALYATEADIRNNRMSFLSVPSRVAAPLGTFEVYCDLGRCLWSSMF